jgi:hypothetical protein
LHVTNNFFLFSFQRLKEHIFIYHKNGKLKCDQCDKVFHVQNKLVTHQVAYHLKIRPFKVNFKNVVVSKSMPSQNSGCLKSGMHCVFRRRIYCLSGNKLAPSTRFKGQSLRNSDSWLGTSLFPTRFQPD